MAKYLLEGQQKLTPNWQQYADKLIDFAINHFSEQRPFNVTTMGEQDLDG
jgi:hypothetical protein